MQLAMKELANILLRTFFFFLNFVFIVQKVINILYYFYYIHVEINKKKIVPTAVAVD